MLNIPKPIEEKYPNLRPHIEKEYAKSWHKNERVGGGQGGWKRFRKVFGCRSLHQVDFKRLGLENIEIVSDTEILVEGTQCVTFRGIVGGECSGEDVEGWLEELEALKRSVYSWSCGRGLKILDLVTGVDRTRWKGIDEKVERPDVIIITEYDVHGDEPGWEEKDERQVRARRMEGGSSFFQGCMYPWL